jgi:DNA adenine methylase
MRKPFLKWAGNKYRVLPHLLPIIGNPKRYCEPFGGSLAVALNVSACEYVLNDVNNDLITIYELLIDNDCELFLQDCKKWFTPENNSKEKFIELRKLFNSSGPGREKASLFIYLNRHCFNGLTRYNKSGGFNVPFGKYATPYFPQKEIESFSSYFKSKASVKLSSLSFENATLYGDLGVGDVVFFDPPYVPISQTSNFTDYSPDGFCHRQQALLVALAKSLRDRGVKAIITNSDCELTRELYKDAKIIPISVSRTISANVESRKKAQEVIAVFA